MVLVVGGNPVFPRTPESIFRFAQYGASSARPSARPPVRPSARPPVRPSARYTTPMTTSITLVPVSPTRSSAPAASRAW